ncbi:MAG: hypothetical protein NWR49_03815, partial [Crocinitomicaceae bacterium]|nr:hypothetical protein [Crocinitomicaceae bacterium]
MKIISLRTALFFSVAVFSFVLGNAQNLTISSTGQSGTFGTNWSISGNVLNVEASGSAEIHPSVITNHLLNTGNLTINLPWQSGAARNVNINASIAYTGSAARTLTINCANDIVFANAVGITSATASLNVVLRSAIGLSLGAPDHGLVKMDGINIDTKGGNLWVGGGTDSTSWNGLTVGNSYAVTWLDDVSGISLVGSTLNTAGGHIYLNAQSFNSGDDDGTNYGINIENSNISSGAGSIYMAGGVYGKYTVGIGMRIVGTTGTSISSSTGAIDIYGYGTDAASAGNAWRHAAFVNGSVSIKSTSGSITMFGEAAFSSTVSDKEGLVLGDGVVVASQTGSILLKGTNTLESSGQYSNSIRFAAANVTNSIRVGYDGTNAYSGNITIEGNSIYQRSTHSGAGSIAVQTTGTLTIKPFGDAFTYMRAGDDGAGATLSYDDDWNFGTTLGGFVYGKTTNNANISFANNLSVAGPIQILGGIVTINANLTSSANGDIFIKGISTNNPSIMVGSGKTIHKSAGTGTLTLQGHSRVQNSGSITATGTGVLNVVMWSDFDNSNNDGGVSHVGNISTKGGHVWLGGSNTNGGSYTWNGLTVGDGPSIGSSGYNANALDIFGNITTLGGDFLAWAGNGVSGGVNGLATSTGYSINVGSGDIVLITDEILGNGPSLFFNQSGGSFTLVPNDGDFGAAFNWDGTTNAVAGYGTGWNFGGNFNYLWLENPSSLTSLTIGKYDGMLNGSTPVVLTNSSNVVFSNTTATSIAGPIGIHGGDITISQDLTSSVLNAAILLQATGRIELSDAKTIQTSGGNITLKSNSSGVPVVLPDVTTGSITLNSGSSLLSNGGNITLGGNYTGTQGQGLYAASNRVGGSPGIVINNATLTAAGGDINIYGSCTSSYDDGVRLQATITTTGAGNIGIYGDAWGGYNGTQFFGGISFFNEISRIETENGDVTLEGILTNSSHAQGYALSFYRSTGETGQTKHIQILSKTGDIQITANPGTSIGKGMGHSSWGHIYFGSPADNDFTATGSIKFIYSSLVNAGLNGFKVKTLGPVTYEPIANSFVADQDFPPTTHYVLADGASSLTIGKAATISNINLKHPISIPGSITVHGGNLYLHEDIASTGGGDISILGSSSVYTSGSTSISRDLTTSGGTIRVEADSD